MTPSWEKLKMGSLLRIKHGYAFKGEYFSSEGQYILLTPGNFFDEGGFKHKGEKEKYYTGEFPKQYILEKGDLIVAMTEQKKGLLGSSAIIPEKELYLHNQRLGLVSELNESRVDKKYIYYLFNTEPVRDQIQATATGTKVKHTSPSNIYNVEVLLPNLMVQQKIASILSVYDDLIENNTRRIKILEEMAQTIYKEWFVNFRFPGHEKIKFVDSAIGKIPDGWKVKKLEEIFNIKYGKNLPTTKLLADGEYPVYGANGIIGNYSSFNISKPTVLVSCRGAASGKINIAEKISFITNNSLIMNTRPEYDYLHYYFIYLLLSFSNIMSVVSGAAQPQITIEGLNTVEITLPTKGLTLSYQKVIDPTSKILLNLKDKNQNLRKTRDLLLPKLMIGEVEV